MMHSSAIGARLGALGSPNLGVFELMIVPRQFRHGLIRVRMDAQTRSYHVEGNNKNNSTILKCSGLYVFKLMRQIQFYMYLDGQTSSTRGYLRTATVISIKRESRNPG
ncbi:hypothetical protein VNO77_18853 [Canavalia gladiata]|uniref:Uncharacterized protein n=1 Tax=Canavalia gladiata TaxID=3824 RepID=A0AAN9LLK4_CANGL